MARYRALLIGNSRFAEDPQTLQSLHGPPNDIAALKSALTHPEAGLFDFDQVGLLAELTAADLQRELGGFFSSARSDDVLMLYYSGHGRLSLANELFLCARDTRDADLYGTAVGSDLIKKMITASPTRTTVVVLDCCHAGAFKGGSVQGALRGDGHYVLASTRGAALANDTTPNSTSRFTQHVVDGLVKAPPAAEDEDVVDLDDLFDYVKRQMEAEQQSLPDTQRQRPERAFDGSGDVAIARRVVILKGTPDPLPVDPPAGIAVAPAALDLGSVGMGDYLPPEYIFVTGAASWEATTLDPWLGVEAHDDFVTVAFTPNPGQNRGRVMVRDFDAGTAVVVPVSLRVDRARRPWFRRSRVLLVAAIVVVVLGVIGQLIGTGDDGGGSRGVSAFTVPGTQAWADTGLVISPGQRVTVEASGTVVHNLEPYRTAGPDGDPSPDLQQFNVVGDLDHGGLIGRIGEGGVPFAIGSRQSGTVADAGRLYLQVNDVGLFNNGGQFNVDVTVEGADP